MSDGLMKNSINADENNHIEIGKRFDIFAKYPDVGQGLALWKPNGGMIRYLLERFSQEAHILNGYQWVYTPHIGRANLWKTSGHLDFYKESMYSSIEIDDEEYYLKPMNCPFHIMIYNDGIKSYRELPVRYVEYGTVYRYELSGALHGLTRVRGFTQDDAHIICRPDQILDEVENALRFSIYILKKFGLNRFKAYISTKNENKYIGNTSQWEYAQNILREAVKKNGLEYVIDEGGGAFYGPKIDLKIEDNKGREWQCSTIQFDFNLPERFNMSYIGADSLKHTPMMVHRALFGSIERFIALLLEHFGGSFPFWLSPVQVKVIPVANCHHSYAEKIIMIMKKIGIRTELDLSGDTLGARIRQAEVMRNPLILVVGDKEVQQESISMRVRGSRKQEILTLDELVERLKGLLKEAQPEYLVLKHI